MADASTITPFGRFLRRAKLDELSYLWNVQGEDKVGWTRCVC
jgi:lipopolysaccharide/colanic/teichoic acid biosynthesis glycosyltransferase